MVPPRIDELQRQVDEDPSSSAFADLAEEYRLGGDLQGAVRVARDGLAHHPDHAAARLTLARALLDLGELNAAQAEFQLVIQEAPDNLTAHFGLEEVLERRGKVATAGPAVNPVMVQFQKALDAFDRVTIPETPAGGKARPARAASPTDIDSAPAPGAPRDTSSKDEPASKAGTEDDFDAILHSLHDEPDDGRKPPRR